jgi:hypothetical protein
MQLTNQLHLAPRLRMSGAMPLLPLLRLHSVEGQLYLYLYGQRVASNMTGSFKTECEGSELRVTCLTNGVVGRIAQSVWRLATGWTVRGSNPGGDEIFRTCPDWPWGPPSLLYNEYRG